MKINRKKLTKANSSKRAIVAVFSDTHCGHIFGIAAPGTLLQQYDEKGRIYEEEYRQNLSQVYLWNLLQKGKAEVKKLAGKDRVHLFFGGDPVNGDTRTWGGNFTNSESNQVALALDVIDNFAKERWVSSVRLASSTARHAFNDKSADNLLLKGLRERNPQKDINLVRHGKATVDGAVIDYAHHGPKGESSRDWLDGRQMRYYLDDIFYKCLRNETPIPGVVLRGHVHTRSEEWTVRWLKNDRKISTVGITLPSFQLMTDYAEKVTQSEEFVTNGVVAVEIVDGQPKEVYWFTETIDLSTIEDLDG